jgi:hypothetical protein
VLSEVVDTRKVKAAYPASEVRLGGESPQELAFFGLVQKVLADLNVTRVLVITIDSGGRQSDIPALQLADDSFTDLKTRNLEIIRAQQGEQRWKQ